MGVGMKGGMQGRVGYVRCGLDSVHMRVGMREKGLRGGGGVGKGVGVKRGGLGG